MQGAEISVPGEAGMEAPDNVTVKHLGLSAQAVLDPGYDTFVTVMGYFCGGITPPCSVSSFAYLGEHL